MDSMSISVTLIHLKVCVLICNLVILDCRCNKNILIDSVSATNSHSALLSHQWSWTEGRTLASSAQSRGTRCGSRRASSPCWPTPGSWLGISGSGPCSSSCKSRPCFSRSCSPRPWSWPARSRQTCAGSGRAQCSSRIRPLFRSRSSCRGSWWSGRWWPPGRGDSAPGISPHTSPGAGLTLTFYYLPRTSILHMYASMHVWYFVSLGTALILHKAHFLFGWRARNLFKLFHGRRTIVNIQHSKTVSSLTTNKLSCQNRITGRNKNFNPPPEVNFFLLRRP